MAGDPGAPKGLIGRFFERFKERASAYTREPEKAVELGRQAVRKAERNRSSLDRVWEDLQTLFRLVRAWSGRRYTRIPLRSLILALAAMIYFVSPADAMPDILVGLGYLDDATVLGFVFSAIRSDLEAFRDWEEAGATEEPKE
ncbi:MAG: YkvA family protein [Bacillota bacterium]